MESGKSMSEKVQRIVAELRRRLDSLYGDRLVRVILFGSQARGDAEPDSDIDVMLVFRGTFDRYEESRRVVPITSQLSLDNDVLISTIYMSDDRYRTDGSPLLLNARRVGVAV
jgi:predicted nucleotidyltransferase